MVTRRKIFVCYGADPALVAAGATLNVRVVPFEGGVPLVDGLVPAGASQGFVQSRYEGIDVTLTAASAGATVIERARARFVAGRIVDVSLFARTSCVGVPCGLDETCVGGACAPAEVPAECLPEHGSGSGRSCDARTESGCALGPPDGG